MPRARARLATLVLATALIAPACSLLHPSHAPDTDKPAPIDLNRAPLRKLEKLPGITPSMARRIVEGRPYAEPHDLVARGILTERELDRILDRVVAQGRAR